jgi:hypothetical protein
MRNSVATRELAGELLGGTVKKYWKIGVHWLAALRDLLALPFNEKAWHIYRGIFLSSV